MQSVLSYQNDIRLLEKERVRIKTLKNLYGQLFSEYFSKISGSQEDNQSQFLVVLTHFLVVADTRKREFCYPGAPP